MLNKIIIILISIFLPFSCFAQENEYKNGSEIIIFYGAEWCAPCSQTKQILKEQEISEFLKKSDRKIFYIDIDTSDNIKKEWIASAKVKTIPTIVKYKYKENLWKETGRIVGLSSKTILLDFFKNEK